MPMHDTPTPAGYELMQPIGSGASSVVWEAVRQSTGIAVALKLLDADVSDENSQRRFDRERDVMATLAAHPGIVTIYDAGVEAGRPWIAMELCRRGSLAQHVADNGPLDRVTAVAVLVKLATALLEAHSRGVVHCDVKPANVMLTDRGEPALGDFGIARVSVGRATTTTVGGFSLDHVAPELLDNGHTSERSDVYSLGTTIWELTAGRPPFRDDGDVSVAAVIKRIMTNPLAALPPDYEALDALLRAMTTKAPDERLPSMAAVVDRARALSTQPESTPFPAMPSAQPRAEAVGLSAISDETILRARPARPRPMEIENSTPHEKTVTSSGLNLRRTGTKALLLLTVLLMLAGTGTAFAFHSQATDPASTLVERSGTATPPSTSAPPTSAVQVATGPLANVVPEPDATGRYDMPGTVITSSAGRQGETTCSLKDAATGHQSSAGRGSTFTDSQGRTYRVGNDCSLTQIGSTPPPPCTYSDAGNGKPISAARGSTFTDSPGRTYRVGNDCSLTQV